jgi:hypothetical protein
MDKEFKECTNCHKIWKDRNEFLNDDSMILDGYQVNYGDLVAGFFLFTHDVEDCGSTIAIPAGEFLDMHEGPMFDDISKENVEGCPGYCGDAKNMEPCGKKCECSYVRDVLDKVNHWQEK